MMQLVLCWNYQLSDAVQLLIQQSASMVKDWSLAALPSKTEIWFSKLINRFISSNLSIVAQAMGLAYCSTCTSCSWILLKMNSSRRQQTVQSCSGLMTFSLARVTSSRCSRELLCPVWRRRYSVCLCLRCSDDRRRKHSRIISYLLYSEELPNEASGAHVSWKYFSSLPMYSINIWVTVRVI
jgi:hypothetical protein